MDDHPAKGISRVFQSKPGAAADVVAKMKEFRSIFERHGGPSCRIYTDYFSGNTDRVVWEFDTESLTSLESIFWAASHNAEYSLAYEEWYQGSTPSIEVAISNGVINLCPDKYHVFREIFRNLKPSGRLYLADIVAYKPGPDEAKANVDLWTA